MPAAAPPPKKLTIVAPSGKFEIALFPGTTDGALHRAVAARAQCESFYLTLDKMVVPLCADGLPSGHELTLHVAPRPAASSWSWRMNAPTAAAAPGPAAAGFPPKAVTQSKSIAAPAALDVIDIWQRAGDNVDSMVRVQSTFRGFLARRRLEVPCRR